MGEKFPNQTMNATGVSKLVSTIQMIVQPSIRNVTDVSIEDIMEKLASKARKVYPQVEQMPLELT